MSNWKIVVALAVLPALASGVFMLAPKVQEEVMKPRVSLTYDVKRLPIRADADKSKVGYSIRVINDGDRLLSNVYTTIETRAKLRKIRVQEQTGIVANINSKTRPYSVQTDVLHPDEEFSIVVMLGAQSEGELFNAFVNSKEVFGSPLKEEGWVPRKAYHLYEELKLIKKEDLIVAGYSSLVVFVTSVPLLMILLLRRKQHTSVKEQPVQDTLFYVAAKTDLSTLISQHKMKENNHGYRRFSDLVLVAAQAMDSGKRGKPIRALKALLLVEHVGKPTRRLIERSIQALEGSEYSQKDMDQLEKRASRLSDTVELRDAIDQILSEPAESPKPPIKLHDTKEKPAAAAV